MSARLSGLTIGALTLSPPFDPEVTAYTATTTNATNAVTASAEAGTVEIKVGAAPLESGKAATWTSGENTVTVTVTNCEAQKVYTVTVTKSS